MVFEYGYGRMFEEGYLRTLAECKLCVSGVSQTGPDMQLMTCAQCMLPMAVPRLHYEEPDVPEEVKQAAADLLVRNAEEHRLSGMFDQSIGRYSLSNHWRAHWRGLDDPVGMFPQELADGMTKATQAAVQWFHDREHVLLGDPTVRIVSDDEVRERIRGMQYAMDKEVYQTVAHAGSIEYIVDPETMVGYGAFLDWYKEYEKELEQSDSVSGYYSKVRRYDLSAMPFERQRALVEQWERLHVEYLRAHPTMAYDPRRGYLMKPYRIFE